jgi:hypothetical protein
MVANSMATTWGYGDEGVGVLRVVPDEQVLAVDAGFGEAFGEGLVQALLVFGGAAALGEDMDDDGAGGAGSRVRRRRR